MQTLGLTMKNGEEIAVIDYPKLECPFVRVRKEGGYYIIDEVNPGYEWIFDPGVKAVDKLHGTNICVNVRDGKIHSIDNRKTRIVDDTFCLPVSLKGMAPRAYEGVIHALEKPHYVKHLKEGKNYGELVGPRINGNLHGLNSHLFVPFEYLLEGCHWKSWIQNKYPKDLDSISDWFKSLPSLFSQKMKHDGLAEGLIFCAPNGRKCKIRRDMFEWYRGDEKH